MGDLGVLGALRVGLLGSPPAIDARWLYDDAGSALFERITELPEYYPTRVEQALLVADGRRIAEASGCRHIVEIGSGASPKSQALIAGFAAAGLLESYSAFDVNADAATRTAAALTPDWPGVTFEAIVGDFTAELPLTTRPEPTLLAFLGSTIGNFDVPERSAFLARVAATLGPQDTFLLGIDLVKSPERLQAAYDDPSGVTAAFIVNSLRHVNQAADGNFVPDAWRYVARWDADQARMDLRLRATRPQWVHLDAIDLDLEFADGDEIRIEISSKFVVSDIEAELRRAGMTPLLTVSGRDAWNSGPAEDDFALVLASGSEGQGIAQV